MVALIARLPRLRAVALAEEGAPNHARPPRGPSNINNFALRFRFPFWNSPHFVHFSFFSYTYGNPILQPLCFYGLPPNGGVYPRSPAFQWSSSDAPKSFICNTYAPPRKCCKQKTYDRAKSFSCNTYKKQGGRILQTKGFSLASPFPDVSTCGRSHVPSPILRTLFQVPYAASPVFATLTKTAGVWGYSSH